MPPTIKRPWYMFYPLAGMILVCLLWSGYWYVAFSHAQTFASEKREALAGNGIQLTCNQESWGGFPFRFEFQCEGVHVKFAGATLATTRVLAIVQAYDPRHLLFLINGPTRVVKGETTLATATHNDALVAIIFRSNGDWEASSDVGNVTATPAFTAASLKLFARQVNGRTEIAGNLDGASLLSSIPIDAAAFKALLTGSASADISQVWLSSGNISLEGQGEITLDSSHRIGGKLATQTDDIDGLLKLVAPAFQLNEKDQVAIKSLVAAQNPNPAAAQQKAEFTAHDGAIYWGPFKLVETAPIY